MLIMSTGIYLIVIFSDIMITFASAWGLSTKFVTMAAPMGPGAISIGFPIGTSCLHHLRRGETLKYLLERFIKVYVNYVNWDLSHCYIL